MSENVIVPLNKAIVLAEASRWAQRASTATSRADERRCARRMFDALYLMLGHQRFRLVP